MNARLTLLIFLFILLTPVVLAKDSIFSDNIRSGESIDVDDDYTFILTMNKRADELFVNGGDIFQNVRISECEELGEIYEVCFYNVTFDEDDEILLADVEIFRSSPDISISKHLNDTEINLGEEVLVTLTIENTGDPAQQVTLLDEYPESILISEIEGPGCYEHENTITWSGHLDEDESKTCTFIIRSTEEMHRSIVAKVRYWNGIKWETEYSAGITIDIEPSLTIEYAFVREDYEIDGQTFDFEDEKPTPFIGETPRLVLKITKDFSEDMDIHYFRITFPDSMKYIGPGNLRFNYENSTGDHVSDIWNSDSVTKIDSQTIEWKKDLAYNATAKYLILKFQVMRTGAQNIIVDAEYDVGDDHINGTYHDTYPLTIVDPGIFITATFDDESELFSVPQRLVEEDDDVDIQSVQPYRFTVYAQNKNPFTDLKNVRFWTITELANFSRKSYVSLLAEKQVIPWSLVFIPEEHTSDKNMKLNISVAYKNQFGESHANSTKWDVNVKGFSPIDIEHDSKEGMVLEGKEKTFFTVTLENKRVSDIKNVFVRDEIAEEFEVLGVTSNKLKLVKDETSEVYKYEITPPVVPEKRYFNITTFVTYFDNNLNKEFNYSKTTTITVIPREPSVDLSLDLDEPEDIYPGTLIDATVKITNNEEEEAMYDINLFLPISRDIDLLGPKTFHIDKLEPAESIEVKNIFQFRPKVQDEVKLAPLVMEYKDSYGISYSENVSDEKLNIENGLLSGPAIFVTTVAPESAEVNTSIPLAYEVHNLGNAPAPTMMTVAGKLYNFTLPPGGLKSIPVPNTYSEEGTHILPVINAQIDYYGRELHTSSEERSFEVMAAPSAEETVSESEEIPLVSAAPEPVSIEELEEELLKEEKSGSSRSFTFLIILLLVAAVIIVAFIFYQKGKKNTGDIFME